MSQPPLCWVKRVCSSSFFVRGSGARPCLCVFFFFLPFPVSLAVLLVCNGHAATRGGCAECVRLSPVCVVVASLFFSSPHVSASASAAVSSSALQNCVCACVFVRQCFVPPSCSVAPRTGRLSLLIHGCMRQSATHMRFAGSFSSVLRTKSFAAAVISMPSGQV